MSTSRETSHVGEVCHGRVGRAGRSLLVSAALLAAFAGALPTRVAAQPSALPALITPEADKAIRRGLDYLVRTQGRDGGWRQEGPLGNYPVSMTALAGLALLANGNTTTQGPYAPQVNRAATFLLDSAQPTGLICRPGEESKSMYGHGFAMLFLSQLLGAQEDADREARIRKVLRAAVALTAKSQSRLGGWYYTPGADADEGSVTITQIQALRSCRNAGVALPKAVIDKSLAYLDKSAQPDGGIEYRAGQGGGSRPPITAAAVACWYNAGMYDSPRAAKALAYCKQHIPIGGPSMRYSFAHYYYAHLYMSQIMWLSGDTNWKSYFPGMRDVLISLQYDDGSWEGDAVGKAYGTAVALFILQLPYNYLPIMQR